MRVNTKSLVTGQLSSVWQASVSDRGEGYNGMLVDSIGASAAHGGVSVSPLPVGPGRWWERGLILLIVLAVTALVSKGGIVRKSEVVIGGTYLTRVSGRVVAVVVVSEVSYLATRRNPYLMGGFTRSKQTAFIVRRADNGKLLQNRTARQLKSIALS